MSNLVPDPTVISSYQVRQGPAPKGLSIYVAGWVIFGGYAFYSGRGPRSVLGSGLFGLVVVCFGAIGCVQMALMAWRLELTANSVRWRSMFRSGDVPLGAVRKIHRSGWSSRRRPVAVIEFAGCRSIRIAERDGLILFAADVKQAAPHVEVRLPEPGGYHEGPLG